MKIAVISGFPPDPYGEAHYSGEVFSALAREFPDFELLVLAHKNNAAPSYERILPNLCVRRVTYPRNRFRNMIAVISLLKSILKFRADVVHFQGTHTPLYGGLFGEPATVLMVLLRLLGIPSVVTIHSLWMPTDLEKLWQEKGLPRWLIKIINTYYKYNLKIISNVVGKMNFLVAGNAIQTIEEYQFTYGLKREVLSKEVHPCTFNPIPNEEKLRAKMMIGLEKYRLVVSLGFVRPDKGFHILLKCAPALLEKHKDLAIVIAGSLPKSDDLEYCEYLRSLRKALPDFDRVILHFESLTDEDFLTYVNAADILVAPYLRSIGASGPIHHALGRGKPVVASAIGFNLGLRDVCMLVPPGDVSELTRAIDTLLSDETTYREFSQRAKNYAAQWSWADLARQYVEQYKKLLTGTK